MNICELRPRGSPSASISRHLGDRDIIVVIASVATASRRRSSRGFEGSLHQAGRRRCCREFSRRNRVFPLVTSMIPRCSTWRIRRENSHLAESIRLHPALSSSESGARDHEVSTYYSQDAPISNSEHQPLACPHREESPTQSPSIEQQL